MILQSLKMAFQSIVSNKMRSFLTMLGIISAVAGDALSFGMSGGVVAVAVIFSVAIGVLFGIYPANKAAKKNPIEALRYAG